MIQDPTIGRLDEDAKEMINETKKAAPPLFSRSRETPCRKAQTGVAVRF